MDFWKNVQAAAEKAAIAAKDLGKKGLEAVEATAEEASKKLNLNLHEKVGAGPPKQEPPLEAELHAYGITPEFADFVRTLNFSAFRDFPAEDLLPSPDNSAAGAAAAAAAAPPSYQLNPWQVRHATLVVQALKEVNELRFVLCPKYMTDEHFWHVYFTLARKHLPDKAFSWAPGDTLPSFGASEANEESFSLAGLGKEIMRLGSQLQGATSAVRPAGLELTAFGAGSGSSAAAPQPAASSAATAAAGAGAAAAQAPPAGLLEEDPDLEAYLQVAIGGSQEGSGAGEEGSGFDVGSGGEDDLDLDSYINELTEEVEAAAAEQQQQQQQEEGGASAAQAETDEVGKHD